MSRRQIRISPSGQLGVLEEERAGHRLIVLADGAGTEAILAPSLGFACIGLRVSTRDGVWSVLAEPPDGTALVGQTTRYGIPILFPWPNRIRNGQFKFAGATHQVPVDARSPHANHGLARRRPWIIDNLDARDDGATCRASVTIGSGPDDPWPFPVRLTVTYRLAGTRLTLFAEARNAGRDLMPIGFGIHPWFTLPLGPGGSRDRCEIRVPAAQVWELEGNLTTGRVLPVDAARDARQWRPLDGVVLDDVYTGLLQLDGWSTVEVRDPDSGRKVAVWSDRAFPHHVVYAPDNRSVVCLEPYTCPTDAFNLHANGQDVGVVLLHPGGVWRGAVEIEASA